MRWQQHPLRIAGVCALGGGGLLTLCSVFKVSEGFVIGVAEAELAWLTGTKLVLQTQALGKG